MIADDKKKFLDSLSNANDRQILNLLIGEYSNKYEEKLKELKFPENVSEELITSKLRKKLKETKDVKEKEEMINCLKKKLCDYVTFENILQPVELGDVDFGNLGVTESKLSSKL